MSNYLRIFSMVTMALILAVVGSGVIQPASQVQAGYWFPHMIVTPHVGGDYASTTAYVGAHLVFQTRVVNDGNVALQVIGLLTIPSGWYLSSQSDDCPDYLAVGSTCTLTWVFVPNVSGQALVRVYVRGFYTDSSGISQRITGSPAFLFNIITTGQAGTTTPTTTSSSTGTTGTVYIYPHMNVAPHVGSNYYSYAATVGKQITFETTVLNNGTFPLQLIAILATPFHWELLSQYDDCPDSLAIGSSCTFTWNFIPHISGPTWVRVYVRGFYTLPSGISQRITNSPGFLFDVAP